MHLNIFDTAAILLSLAAFFAYVNHRFLRMPFTIGMMISGLIGSLGVLLIDFVMPAWGIGDTIRSAILGIDFHESLMHGMLSFLLFAGALHVDLAGLIRHRGPILTLASVGVAISTAIIGCASFLLFRLFGVDVPFAYCLVFGALISPTDPIAVLGIMKSAKAPRSLEIKVAGESLFNDGIGVVVFTALLAMAGGAAHGHAHAGDQASEPAALGAGYVAQVFAIEVFGGIALGLVLGYVCYRAMRTIDEPNLEVLFSVALVMAVTFLAFQLHTSAPLACVIAGLFIGNKGRADAMSDDVRHAVDSVWAFLDEALNAVLFLLVGLEIVALTVRVHTLAAAAAMIPLAVGARFLSVMLPIQGLKLLRHEFSRGVIPILAWGGLKGGISVALALSLPPFPGRDAVLLATYVIVIFSIVVQGLTVGTLIRRLTSRANPSEANA